MGVDYAWLADGGDVEFVVGPDKGGVWESNAFAVVIVGGSSVQFTRINEGSTFEVDVVGSNIAVNIQLAFANTIVGTMFLGKNGVWETTRSNSVNTSDNVTIFGNDPSINMGDVW